MERAVCETCGQSQPKQWQPGERCASCGAPVRREARCAWCAKWAPAGKFCRSCGCEMFGLAEYGPAVMLKEAGVDRLSLGRRVRELDPSQAEDLARRYELQVAVVARRIDEARFCEGFLLQRRYSSRLEEELTSSLPLDKAQLAALDEGPRGPFDEQAGALEEIAARSPVSRTRALASIALMRRGKVDRGVMSVVLSALRSDPDAATEVALAVAHWRVRPHLRGYWVSSSAYVLGVVGLSSGLHPEELLRAAKAVPRSSPIWPWAAAAVKLLTFGEHHVLPSPAEAQDDAEREDLQAVRDGLRSGLDSPDPDLRFTCAMCLGEEGLVAGSLEDRDEEKSRTAMTYLAQRSSPLLGRRPLWESTDTREAIVRELSAPLPPGLIEPVLGAIEQGDEEIREIGARLLQPSLDGPTVHRLIAVASRERDAEVFKRLLEAERLPESGAVVRAILSTGLLQELSGALEHAARYVDFSDGAVIEIAQGGGPEAVECLVAIAERQLRDLPQETPAGAGAPESLPSRATARFLVELAFGDRTASVRDRAFGVLENYGPRACDLTDTLRLAELFGGPSELISKVAKTLNDEEAHCIAEKMVEKLSEGWGKLAAHLDSASFRVLAESLAGAIARNYCGDPMLQSSAARLLLKMAARSPLPVVAVGTLLRDGSFLQRCRDFLGDLVEHYPEIRSGALGDRTAFSALFEALLDLLKSSTPGVSGVKPMADLLAMMAQDRPEARNAISTTIRPMMSDLRFQPADYREPLQDLARAVGLSLPEESSGSPPDDRSAEELDRKSVEHGLDAWPALKALDDEVLLPGHALPTLASYVSFLKAMSKTTDPMATMAEHGLTSDSYVACIEAWAGIFERRDDVSMRYALLFSSLEPLP